MQFKLMTGCISLFFILSTIRCTQAQQRSIDSFIEADSEVVVSSKEEAKLVLGNEQLNKYLLNIIDKKVAFIGNHTSTIGKTHLVDSLLSLNVNIRKVFSPEHGFRGTADAGEKVNNEIDSKTNLPIISLYGKNKKPSNKQLEGIEVIVFDIQDVGVRFYTYISTLHYVMEAAAENNIQVIVLDRPNPNGHYIDGPILEKKYQSFVGMHPVPVIHGMSIGEYAKMINGEKWLKNGIQCNLKVVSCKNYSHKFPYKVKLSPSPNLPNMKSIYLYPSLCFFEGTPVSVGRGTEKPFQQIGHPSIKGYRYSFIPEPTFGAKNPKLNGKKSFGIDFSSADEVVIKKEWSSLNLSYLIEFYQKYPEQEKYFTNFFNLLAGNSKLQKAIKESKSEIEIKASWKEGLDEYKVMRKNYLLYN